MSYQNDVADFENAFDVNRPLSSRILPRWQRKAMQAAKATPGKRRRTPASTPKRTPKVRAGCFVVSGRRGRGARGGRCRTRRKAMHLTVTARARPPHHPHPQSDRFIPNRAAMDMDVSRFNLMKDTAAADAAATACCRGSPSAAATGAGSEHDAIDGGAQLQYREGLAANLFAGAPAAPAAAAAGAAAEGGSTSTPAAGAGCDSDHRVLAFRQKAPAPKEGYQNSLKVLYSSSKPTTARSARTTRHIPSAPERILDAPDLLDDYYLNLVDWGSNDVLAVALGASVYLWNRSSGDITELMQCAGADDYVSSVSWIGAGTHLAVGTASAQVQLWDVRAGRQVRCMDGHSARVSALAWNQHVLSSGGRDSAIVQHDVRVAAHHTATLRRHEQEVCGLAWSPDGSTLASGGNDNLLCLWDARMGAQGRGPAAPAEQAPRHVLTDHCAAVKALAWCPWQRHLLASGGGTADRCIKFWNASTGACVDSVDTGSQVCALLWSAHEKELLSSHGYAQNQLTLWSYPSLARVKELTGHTARVLHLAAAPDGATVCSAGADETLRFWNVFGEARTAPRGARGKKAPGAAVAGTARVLGSMRMR